MDGVTQTVHTWKRNQSGTEGRVCLSEFRGRRLIDVRMWFTDASGEMKPTRKGITIAPEQLDELLHGVTLAKAACAEVD
jgi:Transcriptional Coactivator p15 (PC4)